MNFVEPLVDRGPLNLFERARNGHRRNSLLAFTQIIAAQGLAHGRAEKVGDHAKARGARRRNVAGAIGWRGIGIVYHERLLCGDTRLENQLFAMARPQHVEINA